MTQVSKGEMSQKVPVMGKDELSVMANNFNQMSQELQHTYDGLENERGKLTTIIHSAKALGLACMPGVATPSEAFRALAAGAEFFGGIALVAGLAAHAGIEPEKGDVLEKAIEDLELSVRSRNAMKVLGIATLGELAKMSEKELMLVKNFGQTSMNEVKEKLAEFGLALAPNEP